MSSTRSGGRSALVRAKVFAAASELVAMKGPQHVTMPEIAQRAGVAATSLYRRWGDVGSLLLEMAVERLAQTFPMPDEGSIEGDLRCWSERIVLGLNSTEEPVFLRVLLASWDVAPEKRIKALAPRSEQLQAMLQRGRARGERTPSVEDIVDHLLAPLYVRALVGLPVDQALAEHLLQRLLNTPT
jgi:AcrR family transcriptional regulator